MSPTSTTRMETVNLNKYNVYRGMSPTSASRVESRLKELEDALDSERELRMRAEKINAELSFQLEAMHDRLDESEGLSSSHVEISKKRESEVNKLRKDVELITVQHESTEHSLRKRYQETINDLSEQVDSL